MTDTRDVRALAEQIATELFVNGAGERADRLVLWKAATPPTGYDLGGWSETAVADCIYAAICDRILAADTRATEAEQQLAALRLAINAYRAGIMALNAPLSAALVAHLPKPQGGDSEY